MRRVVEPQTTRRMCKGPPSARGKEKGTERRSSLVGEVAEYDSSDSVEAVMSGVMPIRRGSNGCWRRLTKDIQAWSLPPGPTLRRQMNSDPALRERARAAVGGESVAIGKRW